MVSVWLLWGLQAIRGVSSCLQYGGGYFCLVFSDAKKVGGWVVGVTRLRLQPRMVMQMAVTRVVFAG